MEQAATSAVTVRPLARADLDSVVVIDAATERRVRRAYIERRLAAAMREPKLHAQYAAIEGRNLVGYILARMLAGEFGRAEPALRIELVGVRDDLRRHGIGKRLLDALAEHGRRHGALELRTAAAWDDHPMLRWLDRRGFSLAPNHIVDCAVGGGAYVPERDDALSAPQRGGPGGEIDFGAPRSNDFEHLARDNADVRSMIPADLNDIVRIDRARTGREREPYIHAKLIEALDDSGVRVSLTARVDGVVAGFLTARTDLGDFGRLEPTAVIDTIGVDPEYEHRGIGHALMSQLFANLGALRIERVETVVAPRDLALLGFLYDVGFAPSQRLPFVRRID